MSSFYWQKTPLTSDENFIAILDQVTKREEILFLGLLSVFRLALCLSFVFFVFVFWPIETTTANL